MTHKMLLLLVCLTWLASCVNNGEYIYPDFRNKGPVPTPETELYLSIPTKNSFWGFYNGEVGASFESFSNYSFGAGNPTRTNPTGRIEVSPDGKKFYFADTQNNRVLIYKDGVPFGVLGQATSSESKSCSSAGKTLNNKECMTRPVSLEIANGKLFVGMESGRILVWSTLPTYGCSNTEKEAGSSTPDECEASKVLGKAGFDDFNVRGVTTWGHADLGCATDLAFYNDNLYVAEACRNRVVMIANVLDDSQYLCNSGNLGSTDCKFTSVLGQKNFYEKKDLKSELGVSVTYNASTNTLSDSSWLKKYFGAPTRIRFDSNGRLFVASSEDVDQSSGNDKRILQSRIMIWENNPMLGDCDSTNFDSGGCDADYMMGLKDSSALVAFDGSSETYTGQGYTLREIDFVIVEDKMIVTDGKANEVRIHTSLDTHVLGIPPNYRVTPPSSSLKRPQTNGFYGVTVNKMARLAYFYDPAKQKVVKLAVYRSRIKK